MTFFYRAIPGLIDTGHLYLAQPPLYRLTQGSTSHYARDDAHKDELMASVFTGRGRVEVSRFKGLGEMPSAQLRDTTMDVRHRTLLRVGIASGERKATETLVESLMGRKPELRLAFIRDRAEDARDLDI
jgi:topoisomerase-4 subunit B